MSSEKWGILLQSYYVEFDPYDDDYNPIRTPAHLLLIVYNNEKDMLTDDYLDGDNFVEHEYKLILKGKFKIFDNHINDSNIRVIIKDKI